MNDTLVSFEVSRLLAALGFNGICLGYYDNSGNLIICPFVSLENLTPGNYLAPTQSLVMKWLREIYNISIEPYSAPGRFGFYLSKASTGTWYGNEHTLCVNGFENFRKYEEAVEGALLYELNRIWYKQNKI